MNSILSLHTFLVANYPPAMKWNKTELAAWVIFMRDNGFIVTVSNDTGIVGLAAAYPIMAPEAADVQYDHEGKIIYVQAAIALHRGVMQRLGFALLKRFGHRELVAWRRFPCDTLRVYPLKLAKRNLFRVTSKLMEATRSY